MARYGPSVIGLAVVPLIVHPIDTVVHYAMDHTVRKHLKSFSDRFVDEYGSYM